MIPQYITSTRCRHRPPSLVLEENGLLHGTPTAAGVYNFCICAGDQAGHSVTRDIRILITNPPAAVPPPPLHFNPVPELPDASIGAPYRFTFAEPDRGTPPFSFTVDPAHGKLPPGLILDPNGILHGTPTAAGDYDFQISIDDRSGQGFDFDTMMGVRDTIAREWGGNCQIRRDVQQKCQNMDTFRFTSGMILDIADNNGVISGTGTLLDFQRPDIDEDGYCTPFNMGDFDVQVSGNTDGDRISITLDFDPGKRSQGPRILHLDGVFTQDTLHGHLFAEGQDCRNGDVSAVGLSPAQAHHPPHLPHLLKTEPR